MIAYQLETIAGLANSKHRLDITTVDIIIIIIINLQHSDVIGMCRIRKQA